MFEGFKKLLRHWPIIAPYALFLLIVRHWFAPGLIVGEDFQTVGWANQEMLRQTFPWPNAWDPTFGFGTSMQLTMNMAPVLFLAAALLKLNLSWPIVERCILLYPLCIAIVLCPYIFFYRISGSRFAAAAGATVCAVNTWTVSLIERGHLPSLMAAALIPLVLLQAARMRKSARTWQPLLLALTITAQVAYDLRYAYLSVVSVLILCFVRWVLALWPTASLRSTLLQRSVVNIMPFAHACLWLFIFNLYWIVPSIFFPPSLPSGYDTTHALVAVSQTEDITHAFGLFYPYYHHILSSNGFEVFPVEWGFILVTIFALIGFALAPKHPIVLACIALWFLSVIFVSGPTSWFGVLNLWAFAHIPGGKMFRDVTKVLSIAILTTACGVSLAIAWLPRRRLCAGIFFALYAMLMADGFNPLRFSNFRAYTPTPSDRSLSSFIAQKAKPGSIIFFPVIPNWITSTVEHPMIPGGDLAFTPPPTGLSPFSDNLSKVLSLYHSPLLPPLLCQLGVRYLIVDPDDLSDLYQPWQYNIQHSEALAFFSSRSWLKPIDAEQIAPQTASRYAAYSLQSCEQPSTLAFIAPQPVGFNGPASALTALAQTTWWNQRSAVIIGTRSSASDFQRVGNIINAPNIRPLSVDTRRGYVGFTMNFQSQQTTRRSFVDPVGGAIDLHLLLAPNTETRGTLSEKRYFPAAPTGTQSMRNPALFRDTDFQASIDGNSITATNPLAVTLINPLSVTMMAKLTLTAIGGGNGNVGGTTIDATIGDTQRSLWIPPLYLSRFMFGQQRFSLDKLPLPPGISTLLLQADTENNVLTTPLYVDQATMLTDIRPLTSSEQDKDTSDVLPTTNHRRLANQLDLPLTRHPILSLYYNAAAYPTAYRMVCGISHNGVIEEYSIILKPSESFALIDLYDHVQQALTDRAKQEEREHAKDAAWLIQRHQTPQIQAADYRLRYVDLTINDPQGNEPTAGFGRINGFRIAIGQDAFDSLIRHNLTQVASQNISEPLNLHATNIDILNQERRANDITFDFLLPASKQEADLSDPIVGDFISLQLLNGKNVSGIVNGASPNFLNIEQESSYAGRNKQDDDADNIAINRTSIITIQKRISGAYKSLSFELPVIMPQQAQRLDFTIHAVHIKPSAIYVHILDRSTGRHYRILQQDNAAETETEQYQIDLAQLFASASSTLFTPTITSIEFHFSTTASDTLTATLPGQIAIRDLSFIDWRDSERKGTIARQAPVLHIIPPVPPELSINGKLLHLKPSSYDNAEAATTLANGNVPIFAGSNSLAVRSGSEQHIQAMLLGHGHPRTYLPASVTEIARISPSEISGRLDTSGGVLAYMQSYSSGWAVALLPKELHPTGELVHDYLLSRPYLIKSEDHLLLNDFLNGWFVPEHHGTLLFLFLPGVFQRIGIALELSLILLFLFLGTLLRNLLASKGVGHGTPKRVTFV